jgi:3-hydroxybutyrate dehydrogenase
MLKGKCALITGSVAGLGYAIAEALAAAGCNIVLNGIVPPESAAAARDSLAQKSDVGVVYEEADIGDPVQIERLIANAVEKFGAIDIVVNNAVVRHFCRVENLTPAQWNESLAVNLSAPFHIIRLTLPTMRKRRWGRIFNLSSYYGFRGGKERIGYVTTKTALLGMTRAVALENADMDITCNAICPGTLATPDIMRRIRKKAASESVSEAEAIRRYLAGRQPDDRFIEVENVAAMIAFLCGPAGSDVTGAALPVDGGWLAM